MFRYHINMYTLVIGVLLAFTPVSVIPMPLVGTLVIAGEIYRCHRIVNLTPGVSLLAVRAFYQADKLRRFGGAVPTAKRLRDYARTYSDAA